MAKKDAPTTRERPPPGPGGGGRGKGFKEVEQNGLPKPLTPRGLVGLGMHISTSVFHALITLLMRHLLCDSRMQRSRSREGIVGNTVTGRTRERGIEEWNHAACGLVACHGHLHNRIVVWLLVDNAI